MSAQEVKPFFRLTYFFYLSCLGFPELSTNKHSAQWVTMLISQPFLNK